MNKCRNRKAQILTTGFAKIDRATSGGVHRGGMTLIASRPSVGKSAFLNAILQRFSDNGLASRLMLLTSMPSFVTKVSVPDGVEEVDLESCTFDMIKARIESRHRAGTLDAIFVDYIQKCPCPDDAQGISGSGLSDQLCATYFSTVALEFNLFVIVASQTCRPNVIDEQRPLLPQIVRGRTFALVDLAKLVILLVDKGNDASRSIKLVSAQIEKNNFGKRGEVRLVSGYDDRKFSEEDT